MPLVHWRGLDDLWRNGFVGARTGPPDDPECERSQKQNSSELLGFHECLLILLKQMILIGRGHINPEASNMTRKDKWKTFEFGSAKRSAAGGISLGCRRKSLQTCASWTAPTSAGLSVGSAMWPW